MAKAMLKQKDMLDRSVDQIDLQGITREGLFGPDGIIKQLPAHWAELSSIQLPQASSFGQERINADYEKHGIEKNCGASRKIFAARNLMTNRLAAQGKASAGKDYDALLTVKETTTMENGMRIYSL